eukprot:7256953-Lingulodinium_polyedra.AAC.1
MVVQYVRNTSQQYAQMRLATPQHCATRKMRRRATPCISSTRRNAARARTRNAENDATRDWTHCCD